MILDVSMGVCRRRSLQPLKSIFLFSLSLPPSRCVTGTCSRGLQQIREMLQAESQITAHFLRAAARNPPAFGLIPHNPICSIAEPPVTTGKVDENPAHPVCGAVGRVLVLGGLVSLTCWDPAVHEPERGVGGGGSREGEMTEA